MEGAEFSVRVGGWPALASSQGLRASGAEAKGGGGELGLVSTPFLLPHEPPWHHQREQGSPVSLALEQRLPLADLRRLRVAGTRVDIWYPSEGQAPGKGGTGRKNDLLQEHSHRLRRAAGRARRVPKPGNHRRLAPVPLSSPGPPRAQPVPPPVRSRVYSQREALSCPAW